MPGARGGNDQEAVLKGLTSGSGTAPRLDASGWLYLVGERVLETASVLLTLIATAVVVLQVFCRYVLNASLPWPEEAAQFLFVWAVFLGMALLTRRERHISFVLALLTAENERSCCQQTNDEHRAHRSVMQAAFKRPSSL